MRRLPRFIGSRLYADFSVNASGVEAAYEKLVRTLHGTPKHEPPPLGSNPFARPAQERLTPGPLDLIEERGRVNPAPQQDGDEEPPRGRRIAWAAGISLALISIMLWLADDSGAFWREVVSADVAKVPSDPGVATKSQANAVTQTLASPGKANHTEPVATNKPVRLTSRTPRSGPAAATRNVELTLKFSADGWTEVYDAPGHRLFYDIGQAGSVHTVTGLLPIRLVLGNAAGVAIEVNGQPTEFSDLFRRDGTAHFLIDLNGRAAPSSKDSNSDY
jgi:hypothetical protein